MAVLTARGQINHKLEVTTDAAMGGGRGKRSPRLQSSRLHRRHLSPRVAEGNDTTDAIIFKSPGKVFYTELVSQPRLVGGVIS